MEIRASDITWYDDDDVATFSGKYRKFLSRFEKLMSEHPDDVTITRRNEDGSVMIDFPLSWLRIQIPKKMNYTDEQREALRGRMEDMRSRRSSRT